MANVMYNVAKRRITEGNLTLSGIASDIRAMLLETTGAGYDDPDLEFVSELLAVGGVAAPASDERVTVGARTASNQATSDANNRAEIQAPTITFAADAGQTAVAIVLYEEGGGADANRILISVQDFTSVSLDGGLTVDPTTDTYRLS